MTAVRPAPQAIDSSLGLPPAIPLAAVIAWIMYDFANTIFSMNVVSRYFGPWVLDRGASDLQYGAFLAVSGLAIAFVSPVLGALSDRMNRRMPFLILFTLLCVAATALIGIVGSVWGALLLFAVANLAYQSGLIFYDALLPSVSTERNRGRISGFGVAAGYVGVIFGLYMVMPFAGEGDARQGAFIPTAILFLVFALPIFWFVRDSGPRGPRPTRGDIRLAFTQLKRTYDHAGQYPGLRRFILSRFLYADAMNTIIVSMSIYAERAIGLDDAGITLLLVFSTVFAVLGGLGGGFIVERFGPRRTLATVLGAWSVTLTLAMLTTNQTLFFVVGPLVGCLLGMTWTSDRVFLTRLSPPPHLGEFFGLYGLAGKFAGVVGPLIWALTVETARLAGFGDIAYRIAVGTLVVAIVLGYVAVRPVRDTPRQWEGLPA
jgi:UMF1 family MFS transporter